MGKGASAILYTCHWGLSTGFWARVSRSGEKRMDTVSLEAPPNTPSSNTTVDVSFSSVKAHWTSDVTPGRTLCPEVPGSYRGSLEMAALTSWALPWRAVQVSSARALVVSGPLLVHS